MLDIGMESLANLSARADSNYFFKARTNWFCDWVVLEYLKDVAPVTDANMYRLYANYHNIDIDSYDVKDLQTLATLHKKELELFIVDMIRNEIYEIIDRWKALLDAQICSSMFRIPSKCRGALLNLVTLSQQTTGTTLTPQFTQFQSMLVEACIVRNTYTYDVYDALTKEQFLGFIRTFEPMMERTFTQVAGQEFNISTFLVEVKKVIESVKTMLLMCAPERIDPSKHAIDIYEKYIKRHGQRVLGLYNASVDKLKGAQMAYAIAINKDNINLIETDYTDAIETDAVRYIITNLVQADVNSPKLDD